MAERKPCTGKLQFIKTNGNVSAAPCFSPQIKTLPTGPTPPWTAALRLGKVQEITLALHPRALWPVPFGAGAGAGKLAQQIFDQRKRWLDGQALGDAI